RWSKMPNSIVDPHPDQIESDRTRASYLAHILFGEPVPTLLGHALIASTHCWRGRGICKRRKLWHRLVMLCLRALTFIAVVVFAATTGAVAGGRIRLAVQKTGTLAWELDVIKTHGLDRKLDLEIIPVELASPEAGKVALKGGSADLILSDWLW